MRINKQSRIFLSASSRPSNFGVTIYNQLFLEKGINAVYIARSITEAKPLCSSLRSLQISGCSVSMPLKNTVISCLDELDPLAEKVQSVNTIVNSDGQLKGYNTDLEGFKKAIEKLSFQSVLLYGTGSVTNSIIPILQEMNKTISLEGRSPEKVLKVVKNHNLQSYKDNETYDLFINATPISMEPLPDSFLTFLNRSKIIFDLVVRPKTYLSEYCQNKSVAFLSGFEMYQHQFIKQFKLYTNQSVSTEDVQRIALENHLFSK